MVGLHSDRNTTEGDSEKNTMYMDPMGVARGSFVWHSDILKPLLGDHMLTPIQKGA